ncbi:hypothetical protein WN51_00493 [Melipona quadrifasciata]|uniref:Uncharacterized protein n=1 Tax=Melipona quadrifasciata TaxID=166423 RepID=A0A0N0U5P4_9HYME|nr:hypothetical protein WN51_00493 [Melipona quadrifasciata]
MRSSDFSRFNNITKRLRKDSQNAYLSEFQLKKCCSPERLRAQQREKSCDHAGRKKEKKKKKKKKQQQPAFEASVRAKEKRNLAIGRRMNRKWRPRRREFQRWDGHVCLVAIARSLFFLPWSTLGLECANLAIRRCTRMILMIGAWMISVSSGEWWLTILRNEVGEESSEKQESGRIEKELYGFNYINNNNWVNLMVIHPYNFA